MEVLAKPRMWHEYKIPTEADLQEITTDSGVLRWNGNCAS